MLTNFEQLKNDFLSYLNLLVFPSQETLFEKIQPLQESKLQKIKLQSDSERELSISQGKNPATITLNQKELEIYGFSIRDFEKNINAIKDNDKDSKKLLPQAITEMIDSNNEKLCKIYVPLAILTYTELYEKFRLDPNLQKIYRLLEETIESSLIDEPRKLIFNYFKRAYQQCMSSTGFASIFGDETENHRFIFNITKELKSNFTPYQNSYITLINLIETFVIYAEDKEAAKNLINQLKYYNNCSFSSLMQIASENQQNKKTVIKDFILTAEELFENYIEDHPAECKRQRNILNCVLWFITKIIPKSIFPKDKRIILFGKYTETGREIKNLSEQIIEKATNLVY